MESGVPRRLPLDQIPDEGLPLLAVLIWILAVIVYLALIFITMSIARSKNRSPLGFGLLAVIFPLIALIIVLIIGPPNNPAPPAA